MKKRRDEDDEWNVSSADDAEERAAGLLEKYPRLPWMVIGGIGLLGLLALVLSGRR